MDETSGERGRDGGAGGWRALCDALRTDIFLGFLNPRERLIEDDLIARYAATRHAIRKSFDELVKQGILTRQPNRGVQVRAFEPSEVRNLYDIREALEAAAVARIALPAPADALDGLRKAAAAHRDASRRGDVRALLDLNNRFHESVFALAGNPELSEAIRHYARITQPIRSRGFPDTARREAAVAEHAEQIDAIASGDRERLAQLCRAHIRRPMEHYLETQLARDPAQRAEAGPAAPPAKRGAPVDADADD